MPEVVGEGEIVLTPNNAAVLAAFEQTQRAGEQTTTYLEKLYAREEAMKVIRAERAAEKSAKAKEREAAREIKAGEKAAAAAEKLRMREAAAAEKAADREAKAAEKARARETAAAEKAAAKQAKIEEEAAAKRASMGTFGGRAKSLQQNPLISELETVASMFTQVGGAASQAGILVSSAIRPVALLTTAVGAAGVAALAFPAAALAAAAGAKAMADGAVEAEARLKKFHIEVGKDAHADLLAYQIAMQDLANAFDVVKVAAGSEIAGELAIWARILRENVGTLYEWGLAASHAADVTTDWISFGLKPAWEMIGGGLYDAITKTTRAKTELIAATAIYTERLKEISKEAAAASDAIEKQAQQDEEEGERQNRLAKERIAKAKEIAAAEKAAAREAAAEWKEFERQLVADVKQRQEWFKAQQEAHEEIRRGNLAFEENIVALHRLGEEAAWTTTQIANMLTEEAAEQQKERLNEIRDAVLDAASQVAGAMGDIFSELSDRAIEAAEELDEANQKLLERQRKIGSEIIALKRSIAQEDDKAAKKEKENRLRELEGKHSDLKAEREMNAELAEDKRKAALRAFNANKIAAATQIGIQTAVAMITALGPPLGPIAGAIAAGGIAAAGATAAGIVLAKKPPEFPMGMSQPRGSPDHSILAAIQPNERIVTSRGAHDDDTVRRLNEGRGIREAEMIANVYLGNKLIGSAGSRRGRIRVDPRAGKAQRRRSR